MISDGRSSGPDRKDVGAARTGRSSSSLDESAIAAAMEELASSPTGNEQVLPEGVNCADTVAET